MQGIDVERVSDWLARHVGLTRPLSFEPIVGGRSNLTFRVADADDRRVVLRRPPTGHLLATAHDMGREHRIISALGRTAVPVPRTLGLCTDPAVNGADFYVMEHVDGVVLDSPEAAEALPLDLRAATADHLVEVLASLHAVDVDAVGLGDLAKRTGYVERQIRRWTAQWADSRTRALPDVDLAAAQLASTIPDQQRVVVAHGDYRFGNCLTDVERGRVAAVLDWELCTLGDPLADLGYLGVYWRGPDGNSRHNDPTGAPGFPPFAEIVDRYAALTGLDVSAIDYYVAFSSWRLAVISEGVYARYLDGAMGDEADHDMLDRFKTGAEELAAAAVVALGRSS